MPTEEKIPPPQKKGGSRQSEFEQDRGASLYDKLNQLVGMGGQGRGGVDTEAQSAQLVVEGAQLLFEAVRINPRLKPLILPIMQELQAGIRQLAGLSGEEEVEGEEGGEETTPPIPPRS